MVKCLILFVFLPFLTWSQSNSYEELFKLLDSRNYDEAEPLLKKYVRSSSPEPIAFIQLGNLYYDKAIENFLSDDERITVLYLDSAVNSFQHALDIFSKLTSLESDRYYRQFSPGKNREVKVSHVQDELDDKIRKITKKIRKIQKKGDSVYVADIRKDGTYYGLVIGVSKYNDPSLNLEQPRKDATQLKEVITSGYSFDNGDVDLLLDPTRQEILRELVKLKKKLTPKDNLLIFFAGHGYWDEDAQQGYWWPVDADRDDPTFWLSNSDLRDQIRSIKTAHTLLISDACFSGGILKTRDAGEIRKAPAEIILLYKRPSRRALTSGSLSAVPDRSVFFAYLKSKLEDNPEKYLSSQALFDDIRQAVINNSLVVPQDGVITDTGDQGGDFIFIRRSKKD